MMKMKYFLPVLLFYSITMQGQDNGSLTLSLQEAQDYAIQHNKVIKASEYDVRAAEMARWDIISNGLPRLDGSGSLNDNLKLMTTLLPGEIFGMPGEKIPVQFGSKFNSSYSIQATQLLFNAPYLVGLRTAKLAENMSRQNLEKSEQDIRETVISAYYLILVSEESLGIIDDNLANLLEIYTSTEAMHSVGMAEITDVDQMKSNVTMMENTRKSMERNIELNYNLLRFQLGLSPETEIKLSDNLDGIMEQAMLQSSLEQIFNYQDHIEYRILTNAEKMSSLTLKTEKASVLPSLSAFYSYSQSGMGDKLNDLQWFPNSILGFQLSVPIFASGQRYSRIKRAEFELEKARTNTSMVTDQLLLQEKQFRYNLVNAMEQYDSQRNNVDVARRVYESIERKFREGMASSLDLTQANNNYLLAENNYIASLMDLLQSKLALDKLLNNI